MHHQVSLSLIELIHKTNENSLRNSRENNIKKRLSELKKKINVIEDEVDK